MLEPPLYLKQRIEDIIGKKTLRWTRPDCGLSSAHIFSVVLEDSSKIFVKAATDSDTATWLKKEHLVLSSLKEDFIPEIIKWIDTTENYPILITQDFSDAYWPASDNGVSWRKGDFDLIFETVEKLSTTKGLSNLPNLENHKTNIWSKIALKPQGFLNLKLCSDNWLTQAINFLIDAEQKANEMGNFLVHGDIRSDNICINGTQVIFVDWSNAANGSPNHDLANLLPTLYLEGGPTPYEIMPKGASEAAYLCASHIRRLSDSSSMPAWLIKVFKKLIAIELEWSANCLNLDKPDGINWRSI